MASVAKDAGVIGPKMFVALVVASIVSALLVGPLFTWALRRGRPTDVRRFFSREGVVGELTAGTRDEVIEALAAHAGDVSNAPEAAVISDAVRAREATMGTGLGSGIAIPHARLADLTQAMVLVGTSREGVDWDAVDGKPAQLIFLVLTPADDTQTQLEILATIASAFSEPDAQRDLIDAPTPQAAWESLRRHLRDGAGAASAGRGL